MIICLESGGDYDDDDDVGDKPNIYRDLSPQNALFLSVLHQEVQDNTLRIYSQMLEISPGKNIAHYFSKFPGNLTYKQSKTLISYLERYLENYLERVEQFKEWI